MARFLSENPNISFAQMITASKQEIAPYQTVDRSLAFVASIKLLGKKFDKENSFFIWTSCTNDPKTDIYNFIQRQNIAYSELNDSGFLVPLNEKQKVVSALGNLFDLQTNSQDLIRYRKHTLQYLNFYFNNDFQIMGNVFYDGATHRVI